MTPKAKYIMKMPNSETEYVFNWSPMVKHLEKYGWRFVRSE